MMRRRSYRSNSISNRSSSDVALYSYTLLAYIHIHTGHSAALFSFVRLFVRSFLHSLSMRTKKAEKKTRERKGRDIQTDREERIRPEAKRERERGRVKELIVILITNNRR